MGLDLTTSNGETKFGKLTPTDKDENVLLLLLRWGKPPAYTCRYAAGMGMAVVRCLDYESKQKPQWEKEIDDSYISGSWRNPIPPAAFIPTDAMMTQENLRVEMSLHDELVTNILKKKKKKKNEFQRTWEN